MKLNINQLLIIKLTTNKAVIGHAIINNNRLEIK